MRILMLAHDFKPLRGGIAEYSEQMAARLHELGHPVAVLAAHCDGDPAFDAGRSYPIQRFVRNAGSERSLRSNLDRYIELQSAAAAHRAQVLVANSIFSEPLICHLVAARRGIPWCVLAYGRELDRGAELAAGLGVAARIKKRLKTAAWRRADRVVCVSRFTRGLATAQGIPDTRTAVVAPGVSIPDDVIRADAQSIRDEYRGRKVMVTVARLVERKGVDTVIRAISDVARAVPNVVYVVLGDGPCRDALQAMVAERGLDRLVRFHGAVSDDEKHAYLALADLFVMPNRITADGDVEGFGIAFLEANAFGTPVIGGRTGGAVEAVVDGTTGLLVDPDDQHDVARAIIKLLSDPELAARLGRQGRERVMRELTWEHSARAMEQVLHQMVDGSP